MQYATARKYEGVRGVDDTAAPAGSERTAPATPAFIESEIDR